MLRLAASLGIAIPSPESDGLQRADLLWGEQPELGAAEKQEKLRGLLELLDCVGGGVERAARNHRSMIGEQHGVMLARKVSDSLGEAWIAGRVVGNERQSPDPHD